MISHDKKFIFVRIPRTGSTTISSVAKQMGWKSGRSQSSRPRLRRIEYVRRNRFLDLIGLPDRGPFDDARNPAQYAMAHADMSSIENLGEPIEGYLRWTFVRNPWDWLLSQYFLITRKWQRTIDNSPHPETDQRLQAFLMLFEKYTGIDATSYLGDQSVFTFEKYLELYFSDSNGTTISLLDYLRGMDSEITYDFIGRFENLQADSDRICDLLGMPKRDLAHTNISEKRAKKPYQEFYNSQTRDLVYQHLKDDIEYFDYKF